MHKYMDGLEGQLKLQCFLFVVLSDMCQEDLN